MRNPVGLHHAPKPYMSPKPPAYGPHRLPPNHEEAHVLHPVFRGRAAKRHLPRSTCEPSLRVCVEGAAILPSFSRVRHTQDNAKRKHQLTALARSLAVLKSPGFIFQLPAMNGTRAIIWHDAVERSVLPCAAPTPAPWKTFAGATKADPAGKPASTNREVSFIVIEGGKTGQLAIGVRENGGVRVRPSGAKMSWPEVRVDIL